MEECKHNILVAPEGEVKCKECGEVIQMEALTKEDWQKILTDANTQYRDAMMEAAINKSVADTAREHLKFLDDGKNKPLESFKGGPSDLDPADTGAQVFARSCLPKG